MWLRVGLQDVGNTFQSSDFSQPRHLQSSENQLENRVQQHPSHIGSEEDQLRHCFDFVRHGMNRFSSDACGASSAHVVQRGVSPPQGDARG